MRIRWPFPRQRDGTPAASGPDAAGGAATAPGDPGLTVSLPHPVAPAVISFDEYQLYVASTGAVTDRRAALNRFNYSVSSAIVLAIAVVANAAITEPRFQFAGWCFILALSAMAAVFCTYWVAQI